MPKAALTLQSGCSLNAKVCGNHHPPLQDPRFSPIPGHCVRTSPHGQAHLGQMVLGGQGWRRGLSAKPHGHRPGHSVISAAGLHTQEWGPCYLRKGNQMLHTGDSYPPLTESTGSEFRRTRSNRDLTPSSPLVADSTGQNCHIPGPQHVYNGGFSNLLELLQRWEAMQGTWESARH